MAERSTRTSSGEREAKRPTRSASSRSRAGASSREPRARSNGSGRVSGATLARRIRDDLGELLGAPAERVIGMRRDGDSWLATVEVLELRRIPETMDLLAVYQVVADRRGEIESWDRVGRYSRSEAQGE